MRSIFIGSALIVALNLTASYAVIALTAGAAPLLPERGITRQTVDRRHKADQWPPARQDIAPQSPTPPVSPILVGCDPIFLPPSGSAPVSNLSRCLADNSKTASSTTIV